MTFSEYAKFYDLLYRTKDYKFEFENILKRIPVKEIDNVLELGCGTGTYSYIAAEHFESVRAVDLSHDMIKLAQLKNQRTNISYSVGDLRKVDFLEKFDLIFSLFHVFSYLTSIHSLKEGLKTASNHMKVGGFLCFDVWSSAGFVNNKLEIRRKEAMNGEGSRIIRYSYSNHNPTEETVLVNFDFVVLEKTEKPKFFQEQHLMKYWSKETICCVAEDFGLSLVESFDLHTGAEVSSESFGITYLFKKKS
jgi:SAM-dependent methyltransferase